MLRVQLGVKARHCGQPVPDYAIVEKAALTAKQLGIIEFSASRECLSRFKNRYGFIFKTLQSLILPPLNFGFEIIFLLLRFVLLKTSQTLMKTALFCKHTRQNSFVLNMRIIIEEEEFH